MSAPDRGRNVSSRARPCGVCNGLTGIRTPAVLQLSPVSIIPPKLHIQVSSCTQSSNWKDKRGKGGALQKSVFIRKSGYNEHKIFFTFSVKKVRVVLAVTCSVSGAIC